MYEICFTCFKFDLELLDISKKTCLIHIHFVKPSEIILTSSKSPGERNKSFLHVTWITALLLITQLVALLIRFTYWNFSTRRKCSEVALTLSSSLFSFSLLALVLASLIILLFQLSIIIIFMFPFRLLLWHSLYLPWDLFRLWSLFLGPWLLLLPLDWEQEYLIMSMMNLVLFPSYLLSKHYS